MLELVEGGSLADRLRERKLDLDEAVRMFIALANGLSICHIQNIVHRDIKPGNILLTPKGVPKLSDFGIAKQQGSISISQVNGVIGTYSYMSPEQERGEKATERSDLFSLAKTLYHAVTGEFSNTIREQRIPELIREITLKALEDDPSLRHSTVAEFATELRSVQMQLSGPASVAHDSAPLKDGECAHCHTINAVTRKFCKARDCGKPLVEPCPVCLAGGKSSPTPVWEARCGECNTVIEDYWADTEQDLENQATQIETLAAEQSYEAALESLKPFHLLNHVRTKAWKDWASEIAVTYQAQLTEQQTHRVRLLSEAMSAFESAKYALVTTLLDQIHTSQITPEIRSLRATATARTQELDQLLETLKQQAKTKDYEGLRRNVDRVLTISPGDKRVSTLDQQLRDRDESIRKKREQLAIEKQQKEALLLKERQERERHKQEETLLCSTTTCLNCWHSFPQGEVMWVASHEKSEIEPQLPKSTIGNTERIRFIPERFDIRGRALDSYGAACYQIACPRCRLTIPRAGLGLQPLIFSVLGAGGSGKSVFLASMMCSMERKCTKLGLRLFDADLTLNRALLEDERKLFFFEESNAYRRLEADVLNKPSYEADARWRESMIDGKLAKFVPPYTFITSPSAEHPLAAENEALTRLLCLYENAGEHFLPGQDTTVNPATQHLGLSKGLMFTYDPTSDRRVARQLNQKTSTSIVGADRQDVILLEAAYRIREHAGIPAWSPIPQPLVVVMTKYDVWKVLLTDTHLTDAFAKHPTHDLEVLNMDAIDHVSQRCRKFLTNVSPEIVATADSISDVVYFVPIAAIGLHLDINTDDGVSQYSEDMVEPHWAEVPLMLLLSKAFPRLVQSVRRPNK